MLGRKAQIEVLRYWEEIELLTPPDYRAEETERRFCDQWSPGRLVGLEKEALERWQAARLEGPVDWCPRAPKSVPAPEVPFFTVYVGLVEKRVVYERLVAELSAAGDAGPRGGALEATLSAFMPDAPEDAAARPIPQENALQTAVDLRGMTYLARLHLNPWGKYVDESFAAAGFTGALRHLRALKSAALRVGPAEDDLVAGAELRRVRMARWADAEAQREFGGAPAPGVFVKVEELPDVFPKTIRLSDPKPGAAPVAEGFVTRLADQFARAAGLPQGLPCAVATALCPPSQRTPPDGVGLESFYLADIAAARMGLEAAGAEPWTAPDFGRYASAAGCAALDPAPDEAVAGESAGRTTFPVETTDGFGSFAQPVSAALARLLALGTGEGIPRIDVLKSPAVFEDLLQPADLPSGRWPTAPAHHLYLAQQGAVAGILRTGAGFGPLISVNGPPGTGKSWLLRDVVAEVVVRRARGIAAKSASREVFDARWAVAFEIGPDSIETFTPVASDVGGDHLIVVASNNNAAIRNVTDALPRSYGLAEPKRDLQTGGVRPAFSYWRDCALGLMALVEGRPARTKRSAAAPDPRLRGAGDPEATPENEASGAGGAQALDGALFSEAEAQELMQLTAAERRERIRRALLARVKNPEEVWGLASATLGRRKNCSAFARAVLGVGGRNPFDSTIARQIDDALEILRFERRLPEEAWAEAKARFLTLEREVDERRARMAERAAAARVKPAAFRTPLAQDPGQHKASLWVDEEFERMRSTLFEAALELHAATFIAQADLAKKGLRAAGRYLLSTNPHFISGRALDVFEFIAFLVPVVSTTLASAGRLFAQIEPSAIPWVLIDEASQASPQSAVGILNRARRVVVLGDPRQLMPVVTMPTALAEFLRRRHPLVDECWSPAASSLQTLVDNTMEVGAVIRDQVARRDVWTGLPLRTHRRCGPPMFGIANALSYAGQMVQMTPRIDDGRKPASAWYDVMGESYAPPVRRTRDGRPVVRRVDPKMIREEMALLRGLLIELNADPANRGLRFFVLSPFRVVAEGARRILHELALRHVEAHAGTVHAFQGQEADVVILVLGSAPGIKGRGQRRWAAMPANLLNVAVTRARRDLIVIGDWGEWTLEPAFEILADALPRRHVEVDRRAPVFTADRRAEAQRANLFTK
ncbi:DEAD/DEAH box helicase [uncultured Sutterella sp.]|mgnify:CR=1 FL=1|uniref:DEAD/DEAH box helicase n=1 Tax=uncultured Sutterella sp. TaxID=286133 RepID=UPI0025CC3B41|nr:DEAD/DEAH box helicase [uncultured Sutterella sp.]